MASRTRVAARQASLPGRRRRGYVEGAHHRSQGAGGVIRTQADPYSLNDRAVHTRQGVAPEARSHSPSEGGVVQACNVIYFWAKVVWKPAT